ncbi:hypothetical protein N9I68_02145 [Bacteroidia bacterium]|nr:hypothetical protein [Bacteroidia bacterium]
MRGVFIFLFSIGLLLTSKAQNSHIDTFELALQSVPNFFVGFHNRNTIVQSNKTKMFGVIGGLDYAKKVKLYVGVYGFGKANETLLLNNDFARDSIYRNISTSIFSLGVEYSYYQKSIVTLSLPLQVGIGSVRYQYYESDKTTILAKESFNMMPLEFGTNAYLELLPWVGLKGGVGYRINVGKKEVARLSSPYYNLGLSILVGEIYKELKKS